MCVYICEGQQCNVRRTYTCIHTHVRARARIHTHDHTHIHIHIYCTVYMNTHKCIHKHMQIHVHIHIHIHTCKYTHIHTHTQTHMHICRCIQTRARTRRTEQVASILREHPSKLLSCGIYTPQHSLQETQHDLPLQQVQQALESHTGLGDSSYVRHTYA